MSKIIERVTSIKKDTVKTGKGIGKSYYRVTLGDGNTAFVWSWPIIRDIKIGDTCELVVEQKGQFLNITAAAPIRSTADEIPSDDEAPFEEEEDAEEIVEEPEEGGTEFRSKKVKRVLTDAGKVPYKKVGSKDDYWQAKFEYDIAKDKGITRMSAMKSAIEYANYCFASTDASKFKTLSEADIIYIAEIFFNYFTTGKFVEAE